MRVPAVKSVLFAAAALACAAILGAVPALAGGHKPACPCACPHPHKTGKARPAHKAVRHAAVHRRHRRYAYDYDSAATVRMGGWWRPAYGPAYYGPPPGYDGMTIDTRGFTGGVGYMADGGADGGFVDGYGQVHYAASGNGPTYNSYGQSFQYNPSRPGPFVPRRMGAPVRGR